MPVTHFRAFPQNILSLIIYFVLKQKWQFLLFAFVSITVLVCGNTLWPMITGDLVDAFAQIKDKDDTMSVLAAPALSAVGFWLLIEFCNRTRGFLYGFIYPKFEGAIRTSAFDYVIQQPYDYFNKAQSGAAAYRIDDLARGIKLILDVHLSIFIPLLCSILASAAFLSMIHHNIVIVFGLWIACHIILIFTFSRYGAAKSAAQSGSRALVQSAILDSIRNNFSVRMFGGFRIEERILETAQGKENILYRNSIFYIERFKIILSILGLIAVSLLLYEAIILWKRSQITSGDIVFMVSTTLNVMNWMWYASDELSYVLADIGTSRKSIEIIHGRENITEKQNIHTNREEEINLPDSAKNDIIITKGNIVFENVSFAHTKDFILFDKLSLQILGSQKIGLVGFSGSGKTSFVNLLMRLYQHNKGSIMIDNQDIENVTISSLHQNIAIIPQNPILFNRSVYDNIVYGKHNATKEEVIAASTKAHCHDFILKLPNQYDTIIGATGCNLSGGQKQRIAIARAILKDAAILILDEATSALDTVTEKKIQHSLEYLMQGRTVLVIAHRLSTLLNMDRILVFKDGKIIEDGNHSELLRNDKHYAMMWNMQHDGLLPEDLAEQP